LSCFITHYVLVHYKTY